MRNPDVSRTTQRHATTDQTPENGQHAFEVEFAAVFGSVVVSAAGAEVGVDGVPAGGLSWLVGGDVVDVGEVGGLPAAG